MKMSGHFENNLRKSTAGKSLPVPEGTALTKLLETAPLLVKWCRAALCNVGRNLLHRKFGVVWSCDLILSCLSYLDNIRKL